MSPQRIRRGAAAVGLATSVLLAGCGADAETGGTAAPSSPVVSSPEPTGTPARGRRNATDEMWAAATLLHHDQAIDVADLILGRDGVDERVVRLAQSVRDRQRTQAGQLRGWLAGWDVDPARAAARMEEAMIERGHGGHGGSATGMLNEDQLAELRAAQGVAAVQLFLVRMQEHHLGAIGMAELEREDGVNPEARGLAARITKQNEADLAAMAEVVTSLR